MNTHQEKIVSPTILKHPDFTKQFIITADASDVACGAFLSQQTDGNDYTTVLPVKALHREIKTIL